MKSKEEWKKILDDVSRELGMPASIFNNKNVVLQAEGERNELCSKIRANKESMLFICGQSQQYMADQTRKTGRPFVDVCEAGMSKLVIPLFYEGECVGSFSACGACIPGIEIEDFIIQKSSGLGEEEISRLKVKIPQGDESKFAEAADRLFRELHGDL